MASISVRVDAGRWRDPDEAIGPEWDAAMTEATLLLEREVKLRTPIGVTEAARGSIASEVRRAQEAGRGERVTRGIVGSPLAYVEVLERGRAPGQRPPPADALELWVRRRLGVRDVAEARRVAYVIARAVGRRGTKAVRMFELAARDNERRIVEIFERIGVQVTLEYRREGAA